MNRVIFDMSERVTADEPMLIIDGAHMKFDSIVISWTRGDEACKIVLDGDDSASDDIQVTGDAEVTPEPAPPTKKAPAKRAAPKKT